jgi:hypothetical protein
MIDVFQPLPSGLLPAMPARQTRFGSLDLAPSPNPPAPTESGLLVTDLRTFSRATPRQSKELCPGQRIIDLPRDDLPVLEDVLAIDSQDDGTRGTTIRDVMNLILTVTGAGSRILDVSLNIQVDSDGEYAIVDHNLQTFSLDVALWRFVDSVWKRIYSQVTAQSTNRAVIRFSRTIGRFPVRAVFVAGPVPP